MESMEELGRVRRRLKETEGECKKSSKKESLKSLESEHGSSRLEWRASNLPNGVVSNGVVLNGGIKQ